MKTSNIVLAIVVLAGVGVGSYWLGARTHAPSAATAAAASEPASAPKVRKLLYYRNPMGLADTSPTPRKDPMGMDYIAVYDGEDEADAAGGAAAPGQVRISTEKIQKLGVRTEAAAMRALGKTVRAAGRVEVDERRTFVIAPKFEGYVEKLHVNVTGQPVAKGQLLFEAYSPELVSAQREYLIALQGQRAMTKAGSDAQDSMKQLAESSLAHLRHWDLSAQQLDALVSTGQTQNDVRFLSPVTGIVSEKKAVQGMRFMPGEMLYQVTDLSSVWVIADLSEQDIGLVKNGAKVKVTTTAYPTEVFAGRVTYVYPTMKAETRSIPVRVELANPGGKLKPAMFAQVELAVGKQAAVLSVPDSAVIDTGTRRMVLVQVKEGRFEPRDVELGARSDTLVEIVKGLKDGEQVVVAANFLIDAESNLKAAVGGLSGHAGHGSAALGAEAAGSSSAAAPASGAPAAAQAAAKFATAAPPAPARPAQVGHKAHGKVDGLDLKDGTISLEHGPVPSLKWPGMTMEFKAANAALLSGLKVGQAVDFEFVERQPGEFVMTWIRPALTAAGDSTAPPVPAASVPDHGPHTGH